MRNLFHKVSHDLRNKAIYWNFYDCDNHKKSKMKKMMKRYARRKLNMEV